MSVKVIAIGNILMEDDAIGIRIGEKIKEELEREGIDVIIGETDFQYCLSRVEDGDILFILDASHFGVEPGHVTPIPLLEYRASSSSYLHHDLDLMTMIIMYGLKVDCLILAIEAWEVAFKKSLSRILQNRLEAISRDILHIIRNTLTGKVPLP